MDTPADLLKKEHMGELILVIIFIIYLIMGYSMPESIAALVDTVVGKIVIVIIIIYLFMFTNPILAVLALFVGFDLMRRSSMTTGSNYITNFSPCEDTKSSHFTAFNQFPYTLEQEVVKKMAPIVQSGSSLTQATYKPLLDNTYDATPLH